MNDFLKNLQRQASENPLVAMGVGAGVLQAASKFLNAYTAKSNAKTYKKEIDRRVKKTSSK